MGQTLTHGVYLPDEGERNCYNGLASNWSILDGAVGTIAEHTSALSGKAPLVHTHTKSDITDFPAYGNAAGTICEGNDSRLSDARTPVAHTHTKSDVTDLFNSANTWSGENTYSKTVTIERNTDIGNFLALKNSVAELGSTPASATPVTIAYRDKNNDNLGYMGVYYDTDGSNHFRLYIRNKFTSGAPSTSGSPDYTFFGLRLNADKSKEGILRASFRPYDNNTYDLGSSSYQWNNLYAKNYYYNGTAWGLDKENTWSQNQIIASGTSDKCYYVKDTVYELGQNYSNGEHLGGLTIHDKNGSTVGLFDIVDRSYGNMEMRIRIQQKFDPDSNNRSTSGTILFNELVIGITPNKTNYIGFNADLWGSNHNLGTSTNKWKTLNGINPGALSLPDCQVTQTIDRTGWVYDGATYNPVLLSTTDSNMAKNGWLYVRMTSTTSSDKLSIKYNSTGDRFPTNTFGNVGGYIEAFVPVVADTNIYLLATKDLSFCKFYPCLGNVPSGV